MGNLLQATPFLHVPDLAHALDLFARVLGFKVKYRVADYAYVERDGAAIRILEERGQSLQLEKRARVTVYIDVTDVDGLYSELASDLAKLPAGDVEPPTDQSWNQREFQVRLPDGQWLTFGQPMGEQR